MKKFTILIAALLIVAMGFAQFSRQDRAAMPASRQMLKAVASDNRAGAINLKKSRAVTGTLQHCGAFSEGNGIGTGSAAMFSAGASFEAAELTSYVGQYITKVNIGIANASYITSARVAILTPLTDTTYQIATEQACTFETGMNEVLLASPFQIPSGEAIVVAYEVVVTGGYPLAVDDGPNVEGGMLIADEITGPYESLAGSLNYNWIISATVEDNPFAVNPSAMSFVGFVGEAAPQAQQASVLAVNLTGNINITTAAPFEVSADNTTFATTATLAESGNFYVRYTPAATETLNVTGAVTITAEGRDTLTIALSASTYDCVNPISSFPYVEGFENGIPPCWTLIDADNDGHNWMNATEYMGAQAADYVNNGTNCAISESYDNNTGALNTENWMITKAIALPATGTLTASWYASSLDGNYPDKYYVYIGTAATVEGMDTLVLTHTASGTWTEKTIDLTSYQGQTVYIGFKHQDSDAFALLIDDFSVVRTIANDITITDVTFGTPSNCTLESNTVVVTVKNVGTVAITSFDLSYAVNGQTPVTVTINDTTIAPNATYTYTFEEAITVNEIGEYNVVVTATLEGDDNLEGNEKQASFEKMVPEIELTAILPYDEQEIRYGEPINIQGLVTNNSCELTSYIVTYKINDGEFVANDTITNDTIAQGGTHIFTHSIPFEPEQPADTSEYTITVKVSMPNETADEAEDNEMTATFKVINCTTIGVPYLQNFENGLGVCWDAISNNIENQSTGQYPMGIYRITEDNKAWTFSSYTEASNGDYNQYLITPEIALTEDALLSFDYAVISASYSETFKVMISYTDNAVESFTDISDLITASSTEFENYMVVIPDTTKYIAIHYISATQHTLMFIDNIELSAVPTTTEIALTSVAPATGSTMNGAFSISGVVRNLSVAPLTSYKVSYTIDGGEAVVDSISEINVALGATHEFTHSATISGLENGEHTIVVTVFEPNGVEDGDASDNSMTITINTITCNPITTFPYVEDFENGVDGCWTFIDADGDGNNWMHSSERFGEDWTGHSGSGAIVSESYRSSALTPDNWAITPALSLPENATIELSFYAAGQDASWAGEHYGVYVSTTTTEPSAFTLLWEETMNADGGQHREQGAWGAKHTDLSNYAGQTIYIGFRHFNCSDMFVFLLDDVTVSTTTSAEENIAEAIAVYPNPTNSMVTIANAEGRDIVVINSLGQVVASIENAAANQTIDVSNFANGTYFVKVDAEVVKLNVVK